MYLPRLELIANAEVRVIGDVTIHPSAVIAKGAILEAVPGSQIVIGADVCIGIGSIVIADRGSIDIESGAIVGAEVLIVGNCQIGRNVCIGSSTTIYNTSIEAMTVVASGSVIGDTSRSVLLDDLTPPENTESEKASPAKSAVENFNSDEEESFWFDSEPSSSEKPEDITKERENDLGNGKVSNSESLNKLESKTLETGQIYINQLLVTLFPNGRDFNRNRAKDSK